LKYPENHEFIKGKPDIEERIDAIKPVYSKIGPVFKKDGKKMINWINDNKDEIISLIEEKGDIEISDIPVIQSELKEMLIKDGYIQVQKQYTVKGKKDSLIVTFENLFLELKN
jgi:hypothetical protein